MTPKNFKDPAQVFRMAQAYAKQFAASVAGAKNQTTGLPADENKDKPK